MATVLLGDVSCVGIGLANVSASFQGTGWFPDPATAVCSDFPFTVSASCPIDVKPKIASISPSRALIGTSIDVTINGSGFGADSFIVIDGTGVSAIITSKSATQLVAKFDISLNAGTGNHNVVVVSNNQSSNAVGFFVQVPASLQVLGSGVATRFANPLPNGCPQSQPYGMEVAVTYQVMDQDNPAKPIVATMQLREDLLSPTVDGQRAGNDLIDGFVTPSGTTQSDGTFLDNGVGACATGPFGTGQITQRLKIVLSSTNTIFVRIQTWTFSGLRGCGSSSNNTDVTLNVPCQ